MKQPKTYSKMNIGELNYFCYLYNRSIKYDKNHFVNGILVGR